MSADLWKLRSGQIYVEVDDASLPNDQDETVTRAVKYMLELYDGYPGQDKPALGPFAIIEQPDGESYIFPTLQFMVEQNMDLTSGAFEAIDWPRCKRNQI